ncbi:Maf family protein [Streptococcus agalactiae]|nr:Maf family protein [Streptococcus agalactiae]
MSDVNYEKSGCLKTVKKYVLLSTSPRRKELLTFLNPEIFSLDIGERLIEKSYMKIFQADPFLEKASKVCCELAKAKANINPEEGVLYISADTIIVSDNQICHKPETIEAAEETLRSYFGKSHYAITAVCLKMTGYSDVFYTTAKVDFVDYYDSLENAIKDYVVINKPFDKAGAYSIRDIDPRFVRSITGDINTIIGLPVAEVAKRIFTNN